MTARVLLLTLGGTIASVPSDAGSGGGAVPSLTGADLVAAVPELSQVADLDVRSLLQKPSCDLTPDDLRQVAATIAQAAEPSQGPEFDGATCDGVVVVQGTDTIEESAYLLDLLADRPIAVVVTGAMRTPSSPGADGPANLLSAVRVAADPAARGLGVLVVLADEIHAAAHVAKSHSSAPHAFTSPGVGPIGRVVEGRVRIWAYPVRSDPPIPVPADAVWPSVPILRVAQGTAAAEVEALATIADGLVVEGVGGGHVPSPLVPMLAAIAATKPVVLASRTGAGGTLEATYGYPGSELDLLGRALISAGPRNALQARLWLAAHLAAGADLPS
ncbi:L-asparaginase [Kineosphaera limosa]|uniref:Putative L-asparaginase n=1 Tax=Kineosphaera limosa NBRC 100340 TaxID=1184609 RepID=K6WPA0_9MICO|nr:asparaginase [Kineosphaera limosa]NYD99697.1 L-asparaginase [Kineosphaera limosa]GAB95651.1 putative L-asparaginase [Kineosphaera limosa NBRC 100340]